MKRHLREEISQSRPFPTLHEEVYVELQRTAQVAGRRIALALRPWGLSESQFNVLRILRGCGDEGLSSTRISERMVRHDPDLTRLVDQLEKRGLVEKERDTRDRRVVKSRITDEGLRLVGEASDALSRNIVAALQHVSPRKLESLANLLELAREGGVVEEDPSAGSRSRASSRRTGVVSRGSRRRATSTQRHTGRPGRAPRPKSRGTP